MEYEIVRQDTITAKMMQDMFALMVNNYDGVNRDDFLKDLTQKDYVIILKADGKLCGFSTFMLMKHIFRGQKIRVAFSGDTIICKEHRNSRILPISFGILMNRLEKMSATPLYWMLISKGFRTYRFMPVYFQEFYPAHNVPTPEYEKALMDDLALHCFGTRYNNIDGIISSNGQCLKNDCKDEESIQRRSDPHINFFNALNPDWQQGNELVCLVPYSQSNLNVFISKRLTKEEKKLELQPEVL